MKAVVITSCTLRKRTGLPVPIKVPTCFVGTHQELAHQWRTKSLAIGTRIPAEELYVGRSVFEAKSAAKHLNANLYFSSTGFGLVADREYLPNYDLTISNGRGNIRTAIINETFSPTLWWAVINQAKSQPTPILRIAKNSDTILFISLSRNYLEMIHDELLSISRKYGIDRLRIFTSRDGAQSLADVLKPAWIPYDERFDGIGSPNPGTRSDFPQRVMRHFVTEIYRPRFPNLTREKKKVVDLMNQLTARVIPARIRKSDDELLALMDRHWDRAKGQASTMLRVLRDDLLVACEQKRFAGLFKQLKQQRTISQ